MSVTDSKWTSDALCKGEFIRCCSWTEHCMCMDGHMK